MVDLVDNFYSHSDDSQGTPLLEVQQYEAFAPLNDLVLVKRYVEDNTKIGSFVRPEKFRQISNRGIVIAIGPYVYDSKIKAGDLVTFGIGNSENIMVNGEELLLIRDNDLRGVERAL